MGTISSIWFFFWLYQLLFEMDLLPTSIWNQKRLSSYFVLAPAPALPAPPAAPSCSSCCFAPPAARGAAAAGGAWEQQDEQEEQQEEPQK